MTRVNRDRDVVRREARAFTPSVQRLLRFLADNGYRHSPRPLGVEGDVELVEYLEGEVGNYPLSDQVKSTLALVSAARTLRRMHDIAAGFDPQPHDIWMLPAREPAETMCHGDFAPYNIAFQGSQVVGVIDFDAAHPAPRVWDIAYALYRFAPFTVESNPDGFGSLDEQCERARMFCDEYGLAVEDRETLPELVVTRLDALVTYMTEQASAGDEKFAADVAAGHAELYQHDMAYIRANAGLIRARLSLALDR